MNSPLCPSVVLRVLCVEKKYTENTEKIIKE